MATLGGDRPCDAACVPNQIWGCCTRVVCGCCFSVGQPGAAGKGAGGPSKRFASQGPAQPLDPAAQEELDRAEEAEALARAERGLRGRVARSVGMGEGMREGEVGSVMDRWMAHPRPRRW